VSCAHHASKIKKVPTSRYLSLTTGGSLTHAAFGGESAGGEGTPAFEVCQKIPSGLIALVAVHPAGSVGGVTPSKVSANTGIRSEPGGHSGVAGLTAAKGPLSFVFVTVMMFAYENVATEQKTKQIRVHRLKKADWAVHLFFTDESYGRSRGVGRGLGVGEHLPVHGVGAR